MVLKKSIKQHVIGSPEHIFDAVQQVVDENISVIDKDIIELRKAGKKCDSHAFVSEVVLVSDTIEELKRHIYNTVGIVPINETENLLRMVNSRKQELSDVTEVFESTCKCTK